MVNWFGFSMNWFSFFLNRNGLEVNSDGLGAFGKGADRRGRAYAGGGGWRGVCAGRVTRRALLVMLA